MFVKNTGEEYELDCIGDRDNKRPKATCRLREEPQPSTTSIGRFNQPVGLG